MVPRSFRTCCLIRLPLNQWYELSVWWTCQIQCSQKQKVHLLDTHQQIRELLRNFNCNLIQNWLLGSQGPRESYSNHFLIGLPAGLAYWLMLWGLLLYPPEQTSLHDSTECSHTGPLAQAVIYGTTCSVSLPAWLANGFTSCLACNWIHCLPDSMYGIGSYRII